MTDIDAMVAGSELDEVVAESVMGWIWVVQNPHINLSPGRRFPIDPDNEPNRWYASRYCTSARGDEPIDRRAMDTPHYFTIVEAASKVSEKLDNPEQSYRHCDDPSPGKICQLALKSVAF